MPRRDALSEKKKERLMQEHEQLQKLMLQARSSVRRSSWNSQSSGENREPVFEDEATEDTPQNLDAPHEELVTPVEPESPDVTLETPEPRADAKLFQNPIVPPQPAEKRPLTERELFPQPEHEETTRPQQKSTIRVILPDQNMPAPVAQPEKRENELETRTFQPSAESRVAPEVHTEEVEEDTPVDVYEPQEKTTGSKKGTYLLLLIAALLAGFGGYYLYQTNQNNKPGAATSPAEANSTTQTGRESGQSTTAQESKTEATPGTTNTEQTSVEKPIADELENFDNIKVVEKSATPNTQTAQPNNENAPQATSSEPGKYKVISKAYFHNEPDESTRRKAFIIHWNNAVLTPLKEKNGFVYVVFTNHLGQTSKGWLLKKDLKKME